MKNGILAFCLLYLFIATVGFADEETRQVQEELRKRNLYFGDIDGRNSPDLGNSLKRYQTRKGFQCTGAIDDTTAASLGIERPRAQASVETVPDIPILKSDRAPELEQTERMALEKLAEQNPDAVATPAPPAEPPSPEQDLSPARITAYVQQYLRDGETPDVASQIRYFSYPVRYFDHGMQGEAFVTRDVRDYVKRWPERKYTLLPPVTFRAAAEEGETIVEFDITYRVEREKSVASGKTRNTWTLRPEGHELKIVAIKEERLRE
ncbi:MAG: peptidoglycan-binding domain-containing protein [Chthoniobacterales bacterium]